jgi:hypothetical protein
MGRLSLREGCRIQTALKGKRKVVNHMDILKLFKNVRRGHTLHQNRERL